MDENVFQINRDTWRIEDGMVRFFLLKGSEKALLVDSGMTRTGVRALAEALTGLPVELLNTHSDPDHIGGNAEFTRFYMNPAELSISRTDFGNSGEIIPVGQGDILELGGRPLEVIALPGHTPGSIGLLDLRDRVLIAGDSVQAGSIVMLGPDRKMELLIDSLQKLETDYARRFDTVYPSHGPFPLDASIIPELRKSAIAVQSGTVPSEPFEFFGHAVRRYCSGAGKFLLNT